LDGTSQERQGSAVECAESSEKPDRRHGVVDIWKCGFGMLDEIKNDGQIFRLSLSHDRGWMGLVSVGLRGRECNSD
jgi:hypothetical protein